MAYFKAIYGTMSPENASANRFNFVNKYGTPLRAPSVNGVPFMEAGAGIENIFKFVRIDVLWRLNYHDNPEAPYIVPMVGLDFSF